MSSAGSQTDCPVLGITGPYCSGKSTLAEELVQRGWVQIDVDRLGHESLVRKKDEITSKFGAGILSADGSAVDRKKLGSMVFSDTKRLEELEHIVHPDMKIRSRELIREYRQSENPPLGILLNAAILFKMKLDPLCDGVIWVSAPRVLRMIRARKRDGLNWKEIFRRFAAQKELHPQLASRSVDMYKVDNLLKGRAVRRIERIVQDRLWNRTKPT